MVLAFAAPILVAADAPIQFEAGHWEITMQILSMSRGDEPAPPDKLLNSKDIKFECLSAERTLDPATYFANEAGSSCPITGTTANGAIDMMSACGEGDARQKMVVTGSYDRSRYTTDVTAEFVRDGKPVIAKATVSGRHVGVCADKAAPPEKGQRADD